MLLTPETMKLFASTENRIAKDKNSENVSHLEITEVVLVHCNVFFNNDYQQDSRVMFRIVPNKSFGNLTKISSKNNILLKTFNSEFQEIEVWFTDENGRKLEIEKKINFNN